MRDLVVAGVQTQQFWEDKEKNLRHFEQLLDTADLSGIDVLVFPEMFHTGFTMHAEALAEEMHDSLGIKWLTSVSKKYNCLTIATLIIQENGLFYNRMVAIDSDGALSYYDKRHLFSLAGEEKVFSPGDTDCILHYKDWKIKLQVCFDLRFPEGARNSIDENGNAHYDLLIYTANWPTRRIVHWDILIPARAVENQCYVMAVNRVGQDGNGIEYNGHSQLINALGEQIQEPIHEKEQVWIKTLIFNDLKEVRNTLAFLKDRRII